MGINEQHIQELRNRTPGSSSSMNACLHSLNSVFKELTFLHSQNLTLFFYFAIFEVISKADTHFSGPRKAQKKIFYSPWSSCYKILTFEVCSYYSTFLPITEQY